MWICCCSSPLFIGPTGIIKASSIGRQPLVYKCKSALNFNTNSPNSEANKQIGLGEMAAQREAAAAESQEDYDYAITIRKSLPAVKFHKDQVATSCNKSKLIWNSDCRLPGCRKDFRPASWARHQSPRKRKSKRMYRQNEVHWTGQVVKLAN